MFRRHSALPAKVEEEQEPNRAPVAFEDAARATGSWISTAADRSTRVFRGKELDGDGVPDEPQALSALKAREEVSHPASSASRAPSPGVRAAVSPSRGMFGVANAS